MPHKRFDADPAETQTLQQGAVRQHHVPKHSQAHPGVSPLHTIGHRNMSFQTLPRPLGMPPFHYSLAANFPSINAEIEKARMLAFHVIGDTEGVKDAEYQDNVAARLVEQLGSGGASSPRFCYHVGDVVYFNGDFGDYYDQFYEPYQKYTRPIFSIPGNHDGEVDDSSSGKESLDGWVGYFMQPTPHVDPISKDAPRVGLSLPNPNWTFVTPYATIVGLYTNIPEGGSVDSVQQQWFTNELHTAPTDRALIVALHHPVYSFDTFHSGSSRMADILENAIRDTGRVPNLVLSGHVHNYQRIERTIRPSGPTPFVVCGNGGYHNLHKIHSKPGDVAPDTSAKLLYGVDDAWGFLTLEIGEKSIKGKTIEIDKSGTVRGTQDSFTYSALPIKLAKPKGVPDL